jgi:hypothetical protein
VASFLGFLFSYCVFYWCIVSAIESNRTFVLLFCLGSIHNKISLCIFYFMCTWNTCNAFGESVYLECMQIVCGNLSNNFLP